MFRKWKGRKKSTKKNVKKSWRCVSFITCAQFLRIDFAKKEIAGPLRTTAIRMMEKDDDQIVLQGYEIGLGWTLAIDRGTGNMRITFAGSESAFIIFGACTSYP